MSTELSLFSAAGEAKGKIAWPATLDSPEGSLRTLHEVITTLQRNQRRGTSETKTRGLVSGGGKKPWKQKGTGNARSGSNRSPLWRKGGIIFGPHPRSYRVDLTGEKKRAALLTALSEKAKTGDISVMESVPNWDGKTAPAEKLLTKMAVGRRALLVLDKKNPLMMRSLQNIGRLSVVDVRELNAWSLFGAKQVILTQAALDALVERFPPPLLPGGPAKASGAGKN